MEISDDNLRTLGQYLQQTLNPDVSVRKPGMNILYFVNIIFITLLLAEKFLEGVEVNQNYPVLLLHLVHTSDVEMTIRVAGAIAFKNYIKRNWSVVFAIYLNLSFR